MTAAELIKQFQTMYREHWAYEWGKALRGCVDCSGAFVYAFHQYGLSIAHGSNSIARKYIKGNLLPISQARPGMVAFKVRDWMPDDAQNAWYGTAPGDVYHVGLIDDDPAYVLNAKGQKSGFCRDPLKGWNYVAYLKNVNYSQEVATMPKTATVVLPYGASSGSVNFRTKPDKKAPLVERVPAGDQVEILEDLGEWCLISWSGKAGYMMSNYLEYNDQGDETEPASDCVRITLDEAVRIDQALKAIETAVDIIGSIVGRG